MSESKELTVIERAAIALGTAKHEKELIELAEQSRSITEIKNKDAREQCHSTAMVLKTRRTSIRKAGKDARDDATKFSKAVIAEEDRLVALIEPDEARLFALRDVWDAEREAERQAKLAAEAARIAFIRKRIGEIQAIPSESVGRSAADLAATIELTEMLEITLAEFMELSGECEVVKSIALGKLREMHAAQLAAEEAAAEAARQAEAERIERAAEAQRLAVERAQLAKEREEAAERERQAAAERQRIADEERIARAKAQAAMLAEQQAHERRMAAERETANAAWLAQHEAEQASLRAQQEAADKMNAAMSEIQGIQQQVIIAQSGRLGVRKGGTIECIRETLAETEAWEIDAERFGILAGSAESAKTTAIAEIRRLLVEAEARVVAESSARLEADHAEALIENDRIDAERAAAQEAVRVWAEKQAAEQERIRREQIQFEQNGPEPTEIIAVLADHYNVSPGVVRHWLGLRFWAQEEKAA
jgi:hypothetical protein